GLVIEDVANPFYSAIARAVEDAAHARGHIVITGSCEEDPQREQQLVGRLLRRSVDALLIVPAGADHRYLEPELAAGTPLVFLGRPAGGVGAGRVLLGRPRRRRRAPSPPPSCWTPSAAPGRESRTCASAATTPSRSSATPPACTPRASDSP